MYGITRATGCSFAFSLSMFGPLLLSSDSNSCVECGACACHCRLCMFCYDWLLLLDCWCFRPLARKALQTQPVLPPQNPSSSAASSFDPAQLLARQAKAQNGASQSFHPAASSFAASAANTAAAMGNTLRKASHVLHESDSQARFCGLQAD